LAQYGRVPALRSGGAPAQDERGPFAALRASSSRHVVALRMTAPLFFERKEMEDPVPTGGYRQSGFWVKSPMPMPGATVLRCLLLLALSTVAAAQSPVTQDGYVDNRGVKLFYHIVGHGADTLVVIHGGPGFTLDYLAPDLEPLTAHHTLLFYDQRGAGKSTLVGDSAGLTVDKFVDDLEAIRRHFHMKKLTLLAHSWGAAVAALYAIRYPDQVSRMIIVGGLPMTGRERDQAFGQLAAKRDSATKQALQKWYEARVRDPGDTVACRAYFHLWFVPLFADSAAV